MTLPGGSWGTPRWAEIILVHPISCALQDGQILWQIVEVTAGYFSNYLQYLTRWKNRPHKAADIHSISRQTLGPHPWQKCPSMNLYPFTLKTSLITSFKGPTEQTAQFLIPQYNRMNSDKQTKILPKQFWTLGPFLRSWSNECHIYAINIFLEPLTSKSSLLHKVQLVNHALLSINYQTQE